MGAPGATSLVLIFGDSDLTRGAGSTSAGMSQTAVSFVLTCGGSDPACGAGNTSGRGVRTADSLVLICVCRILSPGDSLALPLSDGSAPVLPSLAETASCVLIRGRSCVVGSWGEGGSAGNSEDRPAWGFEGGSAEDSKGAGESGVCGPSSGSRSLADFLFFSRASTPRRA